MEGIVLFNKPKNLTSTQIVNYFKKKTNKKVGHGGTLDPFAEGLLILGIGEHTKELSKFLKESRKTYISEIFLGATSDTYDIEGKITLTNQPLPSITEIEKILPEFVGEIYQKPPIFSALKIKGKRAYDLARKNKNIEIPPRKVVIYDLKILDYKENILKILAEVGSGVYIRSLANDIGEKLGCGGYLKSLIRIKINEFKIEEALTFEDLEKDFLELYAKVYGRVQGVGYRYFVKDNALDLNLTGCTRNLIDGSVEVLAQGREDNLQKLIQLLKKGPFLAKVEKLELIFRKPIVSYENFSIIK